MAQEQPGALVLRMAEERRGLVHLDDLAVIKQHHPVRASRIATAHRVRAVCPVDPRASYNSLTRTQAGKSLRGENVD